MLLARAFGVVGVLRLRRRILDLVLRSGRIVVESRRISSSVQNVRNYWALIGSIDECTFSLLKDVSNLDFKHGKRGQNLPMIASCDWEKKHWSVKF